MVVGQGLRLAGAGVLLGVALAYAAARGKAALLASVPVLRASRTDPIAAIRAE